MKYDQLVTAIDFMKKHHKGQKRADGSEYFHHPLAVMEILKKEKFPEEALVAAVLHDICEDSDVSNLQIFETFGSRVGFIVNSLSKNKKPKMTKSFLEKYKSAKKENYDSPQEYLNYRFLMYINRMYMGIIADPWILFIKIADQLHNLSTMKAFSPNKKIRKIEEIDKYFLPMYIKCEQIMTPMYIERYTKLMNELRNKVQEIKNEIYKY